MAVSLELARQHLKVMHDSEDALIQQYADAAADRIEHICKILLERRAVTQRFSSFDTRLPLFWGPDPSDISIAYLDPEEALQTITDARRVRDWLHPPGGTGWPIIADASEIVLTYTAGYPDGEVPVGLVDAQLVLIADRYLNREGNTPAALAEVEARVQPYRRVLV